jgi:hypothetical protein
VVAKDIWHTRAFVDTIKLVANSPSEKRKPTIGFTLCYQSITHQAKLISTKLSYSLLSMLTANIVTMTQTIETLPFLTD